MTSLQIKLLILGSGLLAIMLALYFNFGSFVSDSYLRSRGGNAIPADPTCPKGRYSKRTGGVCSGPVSDEYDYTDLPETAVGANGERYNVGTYDSRPRNNYRDSDVLRKPAKMIYSDPKSIRDIRRSKESDGFMEDDMPRRKPIGTCDSLNDGDSTLRSSRNFRNSGYHDKYDTEKVHNCPKKYNSRAQLRAEERYSEIPKFRGRRTSDEEDDYLDNRLSRDYKTRERQFELPYGKTYNRVSTSGYNSGLTCNNKSLEETQDEECCEGFSTFE